ncbi:hypothetical protein DY240_08265, partial [Jiangella rhizosphaerae]
ARSARPEPVDEKPAEPPAPDPSPVEAAADALRRLTATRLEQLDEQRPETTSGEPAEAREAQSGPAWVRARDALRRLTTSRLEQLGDQRPAAERWRSPSAPPPGDDGPRHDAQEVVPWARRDALRRLTVIRLERLDEQPEASTDARREQRNGSAPEAGVADPADEPATTTTGDEQSPPPGREKPGTASEPAVADAGTPGSSWGGRLREAVRGRRTRPAPASRPLPPAERAQPEAAVNAAESPPPPPPPPPPTPPARERSPVRLVGVPPGTPPPPRPPAG